MNRSSSPVVTIDGSALPDDVLPALAHVLVDTSQRLPDTATLRFRDPVRMVLTKSGAAIGSSLTIGVQVADQPSPITLFDGEITALEAEFDRAGTFTVVRAYDRAHRLFRGRRTVSYTQATASDVASTVAQRAGLRVGTVDATTTVHDQISQVGETDWELLQRLARDAGRDVLARGGTFSFLKPTDASAAPAPGEADADPLVLSFGEDLLRLRAVVTSAQQCESVEVRGWDTATKTALTATAPTSTTSAVLPTVTPAALGGLFGSATHVATDVPYRTQAEVDDAARSLAHSLAGTFAELDALTQGDPALVAGVAVSVDGFGEPFDGRYTLTCAQHRFDVRSGYTTAVTVSGSQDRTLLGLASGGRRPARAPAGAAVATVSDVNDPEEQARVKLTFPWLSDDYVSGWARTVQPGAGKDRGWTILPEVGDEVLVCFEQGDFDRPAVVGGLFNGVDTMAAGQPALVDAGSGAVNRRSWVSRTGHRVDLLDEAGQKDGVHVSTKDQKLVLDLDQTSTTITVHADGKVLVEGSQGITLDAGTAKLDLKGSEIALTATSGVTLDAGAGAATVKTGGALSLTGTTAKLEGSATTEVKGGAMCSVSAALVKIN